MALALNKILVSNVTTNQPSAYYQAVTVTGVGSGNTTAMGTSQLIPAGTYVLPATANVVIEFNATSTTTNNWVSMIANNTSSPWFTSDGYNWRANATTGTQTVTLYTVNGGQAATQSTYATS